ncbi:MAG TPA: flagellar biosynthesis protein FlgA [Paracoccaceae bacterium]|nr:flagellar biosynthesis protein FlgA [Paracoccaceae bacterium]
MPGLSARVVCDRDVERAVRAFVDIGFAEDDVRVCDSRSAAMIEFEAGGAVVVPDAHLMLEMPVDIVVEATGHPESGAELAVASLDAGKHFVMATKEAESVVGPLLAHRARAAGLVYTPPDGDQPSLLIGLVAWSRLLGFEIVAAGKASEYDFVFDPVSATITAQGRSRAAPEFAALWQGPPDAVKRTSEARGSVLTDFWQRTAPDLCEMTIVANATGLLPDEEILHAPVARPLELPDLFAARGGGGLLDREGALDIFNCLRRPDEMSFAGGVFVVARSPDPATGELFREKGIPVSADGRRFLISNPVHLLGAEAPMSVLSACRAGRSTGGDDIRPRIDLTGRTSAPIPAGTAFALGWRHAIDSVDALMTPARPLGPDAPVPYYLLPDATARRDIPAGTVITGEMIGPPGGSTLWRLRAEQDRLFLS